MELETTLDVLSNPSPKDNAQVVSLRQKAHDILAENSTSKPDTLPSALLDLLTQIIKPLFTSAKHPALTSMGRKNLIPPGPSLGNRFNYPLTDDDLKPWKTPFTVPLLHYIITSYSGTLPLDTRKQTLEAHFHLLIPPILNMIDDGDAAFKAAGCQLLQLLCEALASTESEMLRKTGLGDVFFDALKANFMLLPTLTPEEESLEVLTALYPAFFAVVDARYRTGKVTAEQSVGDSNEFAGRQERLKLLLRHGVLASLSHLSAGQSFSTSISISLTTYLVSQIAPVMTRMGIDGVRYLREFLPMMRGGLMDPFALAAPDLVKEILRVYVVVLDECEPRVRELWWSEILRGLVGCWVNCLDELDVTRSESKGGVQEIQAVLKEVTRRLGQVVDKDKWAAGRKRLLGEEEDLTGLFEDI
ncbi:hypothetical protein LTR84_010040 [Exophiala bonariae]|uniref:Uncharacterized protein n=1 Tax=Exophiala bonariae TaxID=1690606 RepID=A0AAV9NKE1_9EURO|nr:hypothetical protein LTR84_010040 [Exophiala bonariae]